MTATAKLDDFPGTFSERFTPPPLYSRPVPPQTAAVLEARGATRVTTWLMGEARVTRYTDPAMGLMMLVARDDRLPSWDEVKWARYRLLPADRWFALILPPPELYVDDVRNPFVFELHQLPIFAPEASPEPG